MTNESGPICHRAVPYAASRLVLWMLALPPLIILCGVLLSGGKGIRARSGEAVWRFSAVQMEERVREVRNVILPEAASSRVVVEAAEGYNPGGAWRGMWKANVYDRHDRFVFTATWEDATGELVQFSRTLGSSPVAVSQETSLRSSAEALESARAWMSRISPVSHRRWDAKTVMRQGNYWRAYLASSDGRMLVQLDARTGKPTYLSFRPNSFPSERRRE